MHKTLIVYKIEIKTEISISIEKHDFTNANFESQNTYLNVPIFPLICTYNVNVLMHLTLLYIPCTFARIGYNIKWSKDRKIIRSVYCFPPYPNYYYKVFQPPHGKTNNLYRRKQRRRSASQ